HWSIRGPLTAAPPCTDPDSPNHDQQTALMVATFHGSLEVARMLLDNGADVNAIETFRGQNALMWATAEAHPALVELLLGRGALLAQRLRAQGLSPWLALAGLLPTLAAFAV